MAEGGTRENPTNHDVKIITWNTEKGLRTKYERIMEKVTNMKELPDILCFIEGRTTMKNGTEIVVPEYIGADSGYRRRFEGSGMDRMEGLVVYVRLDMFDNVEPLDRPDDISNRHGFVKWFCVSHAGRKLLYFCATYIPGGESVYWNKADVDPRMFCSSIRDAIIFYSQSPVVLAGDLNCRIGNFCNHGTRWSPDTTTTTDNINYLINQAHQASSKIERMEKLDNGIKEFMGKLYILNGRNLHLQGETLEDQEATCYTYNRPGSAAKSVVDFALITYNFEENVRFRVGAFDREFEIKRPDNRDGISNHRSLLITVQLPNADVKNISQIPPAPRTPANQSKLGEKRNRDQPSPSDLSGGQEKKFKADDPEPNPDDSL